MRVGKILKKIIDLFEYKKPVIHVERTSKSVLKERPDIKIPESALLELLFFRDKKAEEPILVQFFVSESGTIAVVSPTHQERYEAYSGSGSPQEIAVSVINWLSNNKVIQKHR